MEEKIEKQRPGQCCCLIYTSGTTGNPKGVMLSHDNLLWETYSSKLAVTSGSIEFTENERVVSYLPLSHIAALNYDIISAIQIGFCLYYAKPDAL